ncbi:tyrosine-type recombinase/integrase [Desulfovibrio cuneatus]|uniref:tyrosine-type recombinase/integrase n=1 Tax=Desulfovibrio cuneatus TaxID=159728 RepID=UPI00040D1263|nr:site-specific integrase [Desulfovibrio cuneatus]
MATFISKKKDGPKRWKGQVWKDGKMVAVKWFGSTKAEQRAAIAWEEQTKKDLAEAAKRQMPTLTDSCQKLTILEWAHAYLEECERRNAASTFKTKRTGFKFFVHYLSATKDLFPNMLIEHFGRREARLYLAHQKDQRGPNSSNKARKVLTTAWRWGAAYLDGFPVDMPDPFLSCQRYPELRTPRYIPPEADFWKVYAVAPVREQALLSCYLNLAARKSELLRLTWEEVDIARKIVTLSTCKSRTGTVKRDKMPMNTELQTIMLWLWENRQGDSNHVFTCSVEPFCGQPYKSAAHVMKRLCARAGVKRFGFHAIRHLAATILAQEGHSLFSIQHSLRHEKQSTTDRYLHSLGAFKEVEEALDSLAGRAPAKVLPFPSPPASSSENVRVRRAN